MKTIISTWPASQELPVAVSGVCRQRGGRISQSRQRWRFVMTAPPPRAMIPPLLWGPLSNLRRPEHDDRKLDWQSIYVSVIHVCTRVDGHVHHGTSEAMLVTGVTTVKARCGQVYFCVLGAAGDESLIAGRAMPESHSSLMVLQSANPSR